MSQLPSRRIRSISPPPSQQQQQKNNKLKVASGASNTPPPQQQQQQQQQNENNNGISAAKAKLPAIIPDVLVTSEAQQLLRCMSESIGAYKDVFRKIENVVTTGMMKGQNEAEIVLACRAVMEQNAITEVDVKI